MEDQGFEYYLEKAKNLSLQALRVARYNAGETYRFVLQCSHGNKAIYHHHDKSFEFDEPTRELVVKGATSYTALIVLTYGGILQTLLRTPISFLFLSSLFHREYFSSLPKHEQPKE